MAYLPLDRFYGSSARAVAVVEVNAGTAEPISKPAADICCCRSPWPREWKAPIWPALALTVITGFGHEPTAPELDASLRLTAHEHYKLCALAGLRAQRLVRDDQRRSRRCHSSDTIQCVLWNGDPVERRFRADRAGRDRLAISPTASGYGALQLGSTWISALQRDHAPSHVGVADALHSGEDMRADRTIDILDRDGTLQDGLKGLPDIEALGLAANEH